MKLNKSKGIYFSTKTDKLLKIISITVLILFSTHVFILPSLSALTVEEQAGNKSKDVENSEENEFMKKAPARRGYSGTDVQKDPRLACLLSLIIPGGGQVYLKEDLKGIAFFSLSVVGYSASAYYFYHAFFGDASGAEKKSKYVISGLFFLLGIIFHVVGIVEAYNDAIEINEKNFYYGGFSKSPHIAEICIK